jgi:membrane-anchored glycerophosphoryl diester phosphodiesterase (GDPDase)
MVVEITKAVGVCFEEHHQAIIENVTNFSFLSCITFVTLKFSHLCVFDVVVTE